MTCPSDDLTKLSGPELAAKLRDMWPWPDEIVRVACERLKDDDRVWQRNLERERDELRDHVRDLERELRWQKESCERLRLSGIADDDSYDPYKRLCDIVDEECGMQPAKLPVGTLLSMLESALFEWRKRAGNAERDLKEQLDGNMAHRKQYGARDDETMGQWLARVHAADIQREMNEVLNGKR